jgi:hypothetical protein
LQRAVDPVHVEALGPIVALASEVVRDATRVIRGAESNASRARADSAKVELEIFPHVR